MSLKTKTNIEWADYTWNPVTGCLHGCDYCYARRIADRFGKNKFSDLKIVELNEPCRIAALGDDFEASSTVCPYPASFKPTFHKYRLEEPLKLKTPSKIFVSSMGDLFGAWVPKEWIEEVMQIVEKCPNHIFMFLTKNPSRYRQFKFPDNCWIGTTVTNQNSANKNIPELLYGNCKNKFLSIEPIQGGIKLDNIPEIEDSKVMVDSLAGKFKFDGYTSNYPKIDWIIIGAESGPYAEKRHNPDIKHWVKSLIAEAEKNNTAIFIKNNLPSMEIEKFYNDFPSGMKHE